MQNHNYKIILKMIMLVKPLALYMLLAVILGVLGYLCATFIPYISVMLISHIALQIPDFPVHIFFYILILLAVFRGILHYGEQACNHYLAFKLLALLRDKVFKVLRRLAPAKLDNKDAGDLVYMITSDIEALEVFYAHTISPILIAIITSIILLYLFYVMHIMFFLIAVLGYISIGILIPLFIIKRGKKDGEEVKGVFSELSSYTLESLRSMQDILQYNKGIQRLSGIQKRSTAVNILQKKLKGHEGTSMALNTLAVTAFSFIIFIGGCYLYLEGEVTFTTILMSTVLMMSSFGPVLALSSLSNHLLITLASARRILDLLAEEEYVKDIKDEKDITFQDITIDHVHFDYGKNVILSGLNAIFKKGEITGILGKSGSGKSTLLKLMMRFYPVSQGNLLIGETNLDKINTSNLRNLQNYVTQDTVLFHDTIFNNICIANLNASVIDVEKACKQANIHDFIMSLPHAYATQISELGDSLSGGEQQRIALARAFLHNAPCILLDEPTSNLDVLNEAIILDSLQKQKNKTVILVSHRASSLKIAHHLLHLKNVYEN